MNWSKVLNSLNTLATSQLPFSITATLNLTITLQKLRLNLFNCSIPKIPPLPKKVQNTKYPPFLNSKQNSWKHQTNSKKLWYKLAVNQTFSIIFLKKNTISWWPTPFKSNPLTLKSFMTQKKVPYKTSPKTLSLKES